MTESTSEGVLSREEDKVRGVEEEEEEEGESCPGEDRRLARKRSKGSPVPRLPLPLTSPSLRTCVGMKPYQTIYRQRV